jgi:hypothetical protein
MRALICVFLPWIALSVPALANSFPGPYVSFGGQIYPFGPTVNTGPLLQGSYTYSDMATSTDSSTGTLDASVQIGVMHLLAQGTVDTSAPCFSTFVGCTNPQVATDVQFGDTITPVSGSLAAGTLVPFQFTFNLDYSATAPYAQDGISVGGGVFVGDFPCDFGGILGGCEPNGYLVSVSDGASSGGLYTSTRVIDLPVGESTYLVQDLWLRLGAGQGTTTFDASNTAWLNITSLDPDVTFSTGSGFTYSGDPEIPEPSTLLLLSAALLGWVLRKNCKAQPHQPSRPRSY